MRNNMKKLFSCRTKWLAVLVLATTLQGCSNMAVWSFKPSEASGQRKGSVKLYMHASNGKDQEKYVPEEDTKKAYPHLEEALATCRPARATPQALPAIILPVVGKLLFDLYIDKKARNLDELKESAEKSYYGRMVLNSDVLREAVSSGRCLVLNRTHSNDEVPQFIAVLALQQTPKDPVVDHKTEAFTFKPIYVAARSAVAVTQESEEAQISVSFGLSVRGIGTQENGLPAFAQIGETAVTVPKIGIGKPISDKVSCYAIECPQADPIPFVEGNGTLVIGVGVTEKGDVGVSVDEAKSELSAIKAAIGPVISDSLKEKLK